MKKRNIRKMFLAIFVVCLMCLQPMLVYAANNVNTRNIEVKRLAAMTDATKVAKEKKEVVHVLNEENYNAKNKFGYDAYAVTDKMDGVQVFVNDVVLTQGTATSDVENVLEKGVKLILEKGYSLKRYKVVCGDKYNCKTAEEIIEANKVEETNKTAASNNTVHNLKTVEGEIFLTFNKRAFGHSEKETTYWLLLDVEAQQKETSEELKEKTRETDATAGEGLPENKENGEKTSEADVTAGEEPSEKTSETGESEPTPTPEPTPAPEPTPTPEPAPADNEKLTPDPSENPEPIPTKGFAVSIIWEDADNQDGLRPKEVKFKLYADGKAIGNEIVLNGDNEWKYTIKDLPIKAADDAEKEIVYTIKTTTVPTGYTEVIASTGANAKITYNHTPEITDVAVQNVWNDKDNQDGIRPSEIKVQLYANEKAIGDEAVLNANNSWKHTFADLDKNAAGKAVAYSVKVVSVPSGYTAAYTTAADGGLVVTHTHEVEKTNIPVKIAWSDSNNQDGIRPANVEVQLYANSKAVGNAVKINADGQWKALFEDVDVYAAGKKISYTVKSVNVANGYTSSVKNTNGEWVVTQSHTPEKRNIAIEIKWDDDDNKTKARPTEVKLQLYANGVKQGSVITVKATANWKYTYSNLAKYKDGKEISYTVKQVNLSAKYKEYVKGYTITNVIATKVAAKTADSSETLIWMGIIAISVFGITNVHLYKKRKKNV